MTSSNSTCANQSAQSKYNPKRKTTAQFIEEAQAAHGNTYCYEKTVYTTNSEKVVITCRLHGDFKQTPTIHRNGKGCPDCGLLRRARKRTKSKSDFVVLARSVHGETYSYDKTNYTNIKDKVIITCKVHGDFSQSPDQHINKGAGCRKCGTEKRAKEKRFDVGDFIEKSISIHGSKYNYSDVRYIDMRRKVKIICSEHGQFMQSPMHHLKGYGCRKCGENSSFRRSLYIKCCENHNGLSGLYIIKCKGNNEYFYKVGITCYSIRERFKSKPIPYDYKEVLFLKGDAGFIWDLEKKIHRMLRPQKYAPQLDFMGKTECFIEITKEVYDYLNSCENLKNIA